MKSGSKKKLSEISVLVGIVPRKRLWHIIKNQRWYHLPVKAIPEQKLSVEYLAFYFPSVFPEFAYQILYYAQILNINIVKRIELFPDEYWHQRKDADYYQLHLGRIRTLFRPIMNKKADPIIHLQTNLDKLFSAKQTSDLKIM